MARKMFTQEQVRVMAENPYTLHVSTTQITFTNTFKEEFWRRYQEGDTPRTIMYDLGYDPEALGRNRLSGIQNAVCKQAVSAKGFQERPQSRRGEGAAGGGDTTTQAQLRQIQHRLKYLEQEVEFLKNILCQRYAKARAAAMNEASTIFSLIHQALSGSENKLSVSMMCQTAGVSRSGYYAWLNAASARQARETQDRADFELVLEAYNRRGYSKGARGIYMCLIHNTPPVVMNQKKICRLMKKYGLQCPIRRGNPYRK